MNELLLRPLFSHIDGTISGTWTFVETIGKALEDSQNKPVVKVQVIPGEMLNVDTKDLGSDHLYLYRMVSVAMPGN